MCRCGIAAGGANEDGWELWGRDLVSAFSQSWNSNTRGSPSAGAGELKHERCCPSYGQAEGWEGVSEVLWGFGGFGFSEWPGLVWGFEGGCTLIDFFCSCNVFGAVKAG